MPDVEPGTTCPSCAGTLTAADPGPRWCPDCEWNLTAPPAALPRRRRRAVERTYATDARLSAQVAGRPPRRAPAARDTLLLLAVSVVLAAAVVALFVTGVVMVLGGSLAWRVLGALLAMLAVELRPRLPRQPIELGTVHRADQPALWTVLDTICRELGAPRVDTVVLDESFESSCLRIGLRRRPVLHLGLPLWAALTPQGRLALLAHQLGHLVSGDPRQRLLAQPALATFAHLGRVFAPEAMVRRHQIEVRGAYDGAIMGNAPQGNLLWEGVATVLSSAVFAPLRWVCDTLQARLEVLAARDGQRAEYVADALAADVAGTAATVEYLETLLLAEPVSTAVHRWLRVGAGVETVLWEAGEARERNAGELRRAEQRSIREESAPTAQHPPTGLRLRAVRSWPQGDGRLAADAVPFAEADRQLAPVYRRVERALAHVL